MARGAQDSEFLLRPSFSYDISFVIICYFRIEAIGSLETQGSNGSLQRKQIILVDNDGVKSTILLWGEQLLFGVGSMLALDVPFVSSSADLPLQTSGQYCLEYGSETQLYMVPFLQQEERVSVALTQARSQGSVPDASQESIFSQFYLPCDSQGSVNFSHYPFCPFVTDLRDKMTGIGLFVVVSSIVRERTSVGHTFSLKFIDRTVTIWIKLHFISSWSVGRLGLGHTVCISGLTS